MRGNEGITTANPAETRLLNRAAVPGTEAADGALSPEDLALINRLAPRELTADEVYVRSMYLCSDQVCAADWGRFTGNALRRICDLVVGRAVLRGHDRASLPLARFYRAEVVPRSGEANADTGEAAQWVRAWFYWLRGTTGARDLLLNIDGGVYREVSISWRYRTAACSICGDDIRVCEHTPGRSYGERVCHFVVDDVVDVLEGSLVYRGAESQALLAGARDEGPRQKEPERGAGDAGGGPDLLACLSRLPRSVRRVVASGAVSGATVETLKDLGLWVRVAGSRPAGDAWLADGWAGSDPGAADVWLVEAQAGGEVSNGGAAMLPEGPADARFLVLRICAGAGAGRGMERAARRTLARLGYRHLFSASGRGPGSTVLGERNGG